MMVVRATQFASRSEFWRLADRGSFGKPVARNPKADACRTFGVRLEEDRIV
jgi:hypothetical protein